MCQLNVLPLKEKKEELMALAFIRGHVVSCTIFFFNLVRLGNRIFLYYFCSEKDKEIPQILTLDWI